MKKAFIPIFLSFILLSGSVGIAEAVALTQSQINAIIGLLRSFGADEKIVANVNATLGGTGASDETQQWCHTFNTNLKIGDRGDEVRALGAVLTKEGFGRVEYREGLIDPISDDGVFIEDTAAAVTGFQEKYRNEILTPLGLKYGTGYVGKSTRAKLNQLYGCGVTKSPASAGYLEIEPSSASIAVGGSVSMQAMYQPPMPKCPEGFACPQVMPARFPVEAEWTSSNPSVALIFSIAIADTTGQPFNIVTIKGSSNGTADIKAAYKSPSGTFLTATAKVTVGSVSTNPSITVVSPNGGEVWRPGETRRITWNSANASNLVKIYIFDSNIFGSGSTNYITPNGVLSPNTGYFDWVIPSLDKLPGGNGSTNYKIRVDDSVNPSLNDSSNSPFSIVAAGTPSITVTYPNGGESFIKGQSYFIKWAQTGFASDGWIQLQLRDAVNSSAMVKLITSSVPLGTYAGSFNWTVPTDIPDGKYLIWATAGSGLDSLGTRVLGSDFSDSPFSISVSPAGAADASSGGDGSFAALLFSLERQLEELERLLNSLLP